MTKEQLKRYRSMELERWQLRELLARMEAEMYAPKVQQLTGMPSAPSKTDHRMDALVERHDALRAKYWHLVDALTVQLGEIEAAIDVLPPLERTLIRARYVEGLSWEAVCVKIGYSWQQTHRIHARALKMLEEGKE